jgi:ribonuclease III
VQETTSFSRNSSPENVLPYLADAVLARLKDNRPNFIEFIIASPQISRVLSLVGYRFKHFELLLEALAHRSFVHEFPALGLSSNERLEFLGDAILGALITSRLIEKYPDFPEGKLSQLRSAVVNEDVWADLGRLIHLDHCLLLGKGEAKGEGAKKDALLADVFEAFIGAVYKDGEMAAACQALDTILNLYHQQYGQELLDTSRLDYDYKSRLQEKIMEMYKGLPVYRSQQLPDGKFQVDLLIAGQWIDSCTALSKKKAERELARRALYDRKYLLSQQDESHAH